MVIPLVASCYSSVTMSEYNYRVQIILNLLDGAEEKYSDGAINSSDDRERRDAHAQLYAALCEIGWYYDDQN